jgi:Ser/Thr protein kinase RdoA (MazF antagonist)
VRQGGNAEVFRASRNGTTFYVRLAEEVGEVMAVEAWIHEELRRRGASVPEIVAVEPVEAPLGRGALVVTEMPGRPLSEVRGLAPAALRDAVTRAGRDAAIIGQIRVGGFGFVARDRPPPLRAPLPTARALLLDPVPATLDRLGEGALDRAAAERARSVIAGHGSLLVGSGSRLAHGDFDSTHIYVDGDRYAGIIDFGEMRGAPPLFDVGHFAAHAAQLEVPALSSLLEGYAEYADLPAEHETVIPLIALLIALRQLDAVAGRGLRAYEALLANAIERLTGQLAKPTRTARRCRAPSRRP